MTAGLKKYFPLIREREEVKTEVYAHPECRRIFESWNKSDREEFLDFCSGAKGVKMLYDSFFKEILNPESTPERLNDFLSLFLMRKIRILKVLPNDNTRLTDEYTLLITDIVVEDEDGNIINVEVQKIGYAFPGQRAACYSADLLLRQYKRVRDVKKKKFDYREIKDTYTIVLYESSSPEFHEYPDIYMHYFEQKSDTGLVLNMLQKYLFIPLDIFKKNLQNKGIRSKQDAWLAFFSCDEPEIIVSLIEQYPEFRPMYEQVYDICRNVERVMGMFSKELLEMDRNTVIYMIDELQAKLDGKDEELKTRIEEMKELLHELRDKEEALKDKNEELKSKNEALAAALDRIKELESK